MTKPICTDFETFLRGYEYCMETIGDGAECSRETQEINRKHCRQFFACNRIDLLKAVMRGTTWDSLGQDFYLTRNYHGSGFWDKGLDVLGDRLTAAANAFGETYEYLDAHGCIALDYVKSLA